MFFVDGFNLYHSIQHWALKPKTKHFRIYKWLDLKKMCGVFVAPSGKLEGVFYFTALANHLPDKLKRHIIYIRALEMTGVNIVYGEYKDKQKWCRNCKSYFMGKEEKQTDVNVAVFLFKFAVEDRYDTAILLSADSDLVPAIRAAKQSFPHKKFGILSPFGRRSKELTDVADCKFKISEAQLKRNTFLQRIPLPNGTTLDCPGEWL